jgi:hypothetical protein
MLYCYSLYIIASIYTLQNLGTPAKFFLGRVTSLYFYEKKLNC